MIDELLTDNEIMELNNKFIITERESVFLNAIEPFRCVVCRKIPTREHKNHMIGKDCYCEKHFISGAKV